MAHRNRYYLDTKTQDVVIVRWWVQKGFSSREGARVMRIRDSNFYHVERCDDRLRGPLSPLEVLARMSK